LTRYYYSHQLQTICSKFIVSFAHTRVIGLCFQYRNSTNLEPPKMEAITPPITTALLRPPTPIGFRRLGTTPKPPPIDIA